MPLLDNIYRPDQEALDQLKNGGDVEKAKVHAMLAIAAALTDLSAEVNGLATEAAPLHVSVD